MKPNNKFATTTSGHHQYYGMKKGAMAALASILTLAGTAASAAPIISYDIINGRASGYGRWSNDYTGTQTTVGQLTNFTGGSGTLNDGIVPTSNSNDQLFLTSDESTITGYFSNLQNVSVIEILSSYFGNGIPGNITAAVITIGGVSARVTSTGFGSTNTANNQPINERFILTGDLASAIGNSFTLSQIETAGNAGNFAIGELTATSADVTSAVPEPATWALMLFGFGGLGYTMRRRPRTSARIRFA